MRIQEWNFRILALASALLLVDCLQDLQAQDFLPVEVAAQPGAHQIIVSVQGRPFTRFLYPDSLEKPVLFPLYAPDGVCITRGFPLEPKAHEPQDHPHHIGLWFTYEKVNGLDFWNNSYAIPAEKKSAYGWIRLDRIISARSGQSGEIRYRADWTDIGHRVLLVENTRFVFTASPDLRMIDRITELEAVTDVDFEDAKDGLLGLRVAHELELPSAQPASYTDAKGNITSLPAESRSAVSGDYLTSAGKTGDSAWGTRAAWCMLRGKMQGDSISVVIIDHPGNPGYPTYWHARGYGLFAANPLGQKVFSQGKEVLGFKLRTGQKVMFRYRIILASAATSLSVARINQLAAEFEKKYQK